jgi:hypothetical protein
MLEGTVMQRIGFAICAMFVVGLIHAGEMGCIEDALQPRLDVSIVEYSVTPAVGLVKFADQDPADRNDSPRRGGI